MANITTPRRQIMTLSNKWRNVNKKFKREAKEYKFPGKDRITHTSKLIYMGDQLGNTLVDLFINRSQTFVNNFLQYDVIQNTIVLLIKTLTIILKVVEFWFILKQWSAFELN